MLVARIGTIPVYLHWSVPAGCIFPAAFAGYEPLAFIYSCIGYILLVGIHELGHVLAVHITGNRVLSVEISGSGGLCRFHFSGNTTHALLIFCGGLLAQVVLFIAAITALVTLGSNLHSKFLGCLLMMFTFFNALLFFVNIIPSKTANLGAGTDGYVIWKIIERMYLSKTARKKS